MGRVKSLKRTVIKTNGNKQPVKEKILKPIIQHDGYVNITLYKDLKPKIIRLHRVVISSFNECDGFKTQINHIDGCKTNNKLLNLEWCTASENIKHGHKMGLYSSRFGEKSHNSILKTEDVVAIKVLIQLKFKNIFLAKCFNISEQTICDIKKCRRWSHINIQTLEDEQINEIVERWKPE